MKILQNVMIAGASLLTCVSCGQRPSDNVVNPGSETGFSLSFFRKVLETSSDKENVSVSPYSAGVALSMLAEGAGGTTLEELDKALAGCRLKSEDLGKNADSIVIKSANALWADSNFDLKKSYISKISGDYDAKVTALDFSSGASVDAINSWARENTAGRIDKVVEKLSPDMVAILSNALYFKAPWHNPFDKDMTAEDVFHGVSGDNKVPFMSKTASFEYAEYDGNKIARIPYLGGRFAMTIILPSDKVGVRGLQPYIHEPGLDEVTGSMEVTRIKLTLPKFRIETGFSLIPALNAMGVETAFADGADLSVIADGPLKVSEADQKVFLQVDEAGSEAAAVTKIGIALTSIRDDRNIPVMNVNRPFYYMISDTETDRIYFIGRIVNL